MTNPTTDQDVQNLIAFIAREPSIPATTRRDFLTHISENGIDRKSTEFMQKHLERLRQESQGNRDRAEHKTQVYQASLFNEEIPEISAKTQTINQAESDMEAILESFKENYKGHEKEVAQTQENTETNENQLQIEALKAQL